MCSSKNWLQHLASSITHWSRHESHMVAWKFAFAQDLLSSLWSDNFLCCCFFIRACLYFDCCVGLDFSKCIRSKRTNRREKKLLKYLPWCRQVQRSGIFVQVSTKNRIQESVWLTFDIRLIRLQNGSPASSFRPSNRRSDCWFRCACDAFCFQFQSLQFKWDVQKLSWDFYTLINTLSNTLCILLHYSWNW